MKTFSKFIYETHLVLEKRGDPEYNYEVALERLYNHLIKGADRANVKGKKMRLAISKGDIMTAIDIIAQELQKAKTDSDHPLHFDNAPDEGFTGGKKTVDHKKSYYDNLEDQTYTILNDIQSRTGRSLGAKGFVAKRQGEAKVKLSPEGQRLYDKFQDTSKPDIVFQDPIRPERQSKTSLKKAPPPGQKSGAVAASSGSEETYGNYGMAINAAIKRALKSGKMTKDEAEKARFSGMSIAGKIRNIMRGSKGQSQKDLLPQVQKLHGDLEGLIPGVSKEVGIEQLTGKGKYGSSGAVDRLLTTGRGGGTTEDPRAVSITQRARQGKGTTKTKAGPVQRPMAVTADIKKPTTGEPSSFATFSQQTSQQQTPPPPQPAQPVIPKGIKPQHIGNFIRNQAVQRAHQARLQQSQTTTQQPQPQTAPPPSTQQQTPSPEQQNQRKKKIQPQQPVPATPITQ